MDQKTRDRMQELRNKLAALCLSSIEEQIVTSKGSVSANAAAHAAAELIVKEDIIDADSEELLAFCREMALSVPAISRGWPMRHRVLAERLCIRILRRHLGLELSLEEDELTIDGTVDEMISWCRGHEKEVLGRLGHLPIPRSAREDFAEAFSLPTNNDAERKLNARAAADAWDLAFERVSDTAISHQRMTVHAERVLAAIVRREDDTEA